MMTQHLTGLGTPEAAGKRSLFQPPKPETSPLQHQMETQPVTLQENPSPTPKAQNSKNRIRRVHITIDLTLEALQTIQAIQQQYRLRTGKVLPLWKAVSQAIEHYGQVKKNR